jgi:hypothetical protein
MTQAMARISNRAITEAITETSHDVVFAARASPPGKTGSCEAWKGTEPGGIVATRNCWEWLNVPAFGGRVAQTTVSALENVDDGEMDSEALKAPESARNPEPQGGIVLHLTKVVFSNGGNPGENKAATDRTNEVDVPKLGEDPT